MWSFSRPPQTEDIGIKLFVETERRGKNAKNITKLMHKKSYLRKNLKSKGE